MNTCILKYELFRELSNQRVPLPEGAEILTVAVQHNRIQMWALVSPTTDRVDYREFLLVYTSPDTYVPEDAEYLGTVLLDDGSYVLHVFELLEGPRQ